MTIRKFTITLSIFANLCVASCNKKENKSHGKPGSELYPLALGNKWTYRYTSKDTSFLYSEEIDGYIRYLGEVYYRRKTALGGDYYYRNADFNSVEIFENSLLTVSTRFKIVDFAQMIGNIGQGEDSTYYYAYPEQYIINGYPSILIRSVYPNKYTVKVVRKYVARGVGVIREELYKISDSSSDNRLYTADLVDYHLY